MSEPEINNSFRAKNELNVFTMIIIFLLLLIPNRPTKCESICDTISVDAVTQLFNGSIAIFSQNDVWFLEKEQNQLMGPCPISQVYKGLNGPVDAALTITRHDMITDFIGASIYFENKMFFTFKNLGQYQAEWGTIVYVPVKGKQEEIGQADPEANDYMKRTISYAFFDPIDGKCKFVFGDGTSLAFTFDMGVNFDTPLVSTIDEELSRYGVDYVPKTLTAALTLANDKTSQLYLFEGNTFCAITLDTTVASQTCRLKPIKDFFKCESISLKNSCLSSRDAISATVDAPIEARNRPPKTSESDPTAVASSKANPKIRSQNETTDSDKKKPGTGSASALMVNFIQLVSLLALISSFLI